MKRRNKFNVRTDKIGKAERTVEGILFPSKREAKRFAELRLLERAGEIRDLSLQPKFDFVIGDKPVLIKSRGFPNGRRAKYTADFMYYQGDTLVVEDVKSSATDTEASRLRRALVEAIYGIEVRLV